MTQLSALLHTCLYTIRVGLLKRFVCVKCSVDLQVRVSDVFLLSLSDKILDQWDLSCVFSGSPLVRAVAHHALKKARYNSVIGSNALFCCARYGWTAADLLAGKIDVSNSYFQKICDDSFSRSEICVARSLFEVICVREGELYLPDSFLQLSEINEIISALCTVSL